jgi:hypothetical protein
VKLKIKEAITHRERILTNIHERTKEEEDALADRLEKMEIKFKNSNLNFVNVVSER